MTISKPKIMIVEDIKANVRFLQKHLSEEYQCVAAYDGKEALSLVEEEKPDLILLDIEMPEMNGFDVCKALKNNDRTMGIPVIFLTSLAETDDETRGLELGAVDYVTKPFRLPIVKARIRNHIELKKARDLLEQQAFIDGLTRIPNRRRFDEVLEREWTKAHRYQTELSLILMDIDHFKQFNDNYGHQNGDICLQKVALAISTAVNRGTDFHARYGGEEFAVILPDTDEAGALTVAEAIRKELSSQAIPHEHSDTSTYVTFSQGIATTVPIEHQDPSELLKAADKALYEAKENGRDQVRTCTLAKE